MHEFSVSLLRVCDGRRRHVFCARRGPRAIPAFSLSTPVVDVATYRCSPSNGRISHLYRARERANKIQTKEGGRLFDTRDGRDLLLTAFHTRTLHCIHTHCTLWFAAAAAIALPSCLPTPLHHHLPTCLACHMPLAVPCAATTPLHCAFFSCLTCCTSPCLHPCTHAFCLYASATWLRWDHTWHATCLRLRTLPRILISPALPVPACLLLLLTPSPSRLPCCLAFLLCLPATFTLHAMCTPAATARAFFKHLTALNYLHFTCCTLPSSLLRGCLPASSPAYYGYSLLLCLAIPPCLPPRLRHSYRRLPAATYMSRHLLMTPPYTGAFDCGTTS